MRQLARTPWFQFAVIGATLAALELTSHGREGELIIDVANVLAAAAVLLGVKLNRPRAAAIWSCCALSISLAEAGGLVYQLFPGHPATAPVFILAQLLLLIDTLALGVGVLGASRRMSPRGDAASTLDTSILAVATSSILWTLVLRPLFDRSHGTTLGRFNAALCPVLFALMLVLLLRVVLVDARRPAALWAMVAALTTSLAANLTIAVAAIHGGGGNSALFYTGDLATSVLLGVAALHPSMREMSESSPPRPPTFGAARAAALAAALVAGPLAGVLSGPLFGMSINLWAIVVPTMIMTALVIVRVRWLFAAFDHARSAVVLSERRFRSLVENQSDHVLVVDANGAITYQSPSTALLLGFGPGALIGTPIRSLASIEDLVSLDALLEEALVTPTSPTRGTIQIVDAAGTLRSVEATVTNLLGDMAVLGTVVVLHDVTERTLFEQKLQYQSLHDALTGLPNRKLLVANAERLLALARQRGGTVAALVVDLDDFKSVNDSLGHAAGDELLLAVAGRLQRTIRPPAVVGRIGGDEFVVLLDSVSASGGAELVADRLRDVLRVPFSVAGRSYSMSASVGIANSCVFAASELLRDADAAMHRAKLLGKDRWALFEPSMHVAAYDRLELLADLREAAARGELSVAYQPTVELSGLAVRGMEALVRWDHPVRGRLAPSVFVPLAEESGLIVEIGEFVLGEACRAAARLQQPDAPLEVAVNVSIRQLDSAEFVDDVRRALASSGLDPHLLVLELTESMLVRDPEVVIGRIEDLKQLGVRIAIDDFGTGYSSLSYLRRFPIDVLKIDQTFVASLPGCPEAIAVVRALVQLGKGLGLELVAEGIELPGQLEVLKAEGCDIGQGYLFARPCEGTLLDEQATHWVRARSGEANGATAALALEPR